ncbi:MAG: hypothetical protein HYY06_01275 [Deltaproteobacteria bacterium]|nr:hypothetical protein [Deltaproteobacteria bacterium]
MLRWPTPSLCALAVLVVAGCPSGGPDTAGGDAGTGECSPPCGEGLVCSGGRCIQPSIDEDGDGFPAVLDCDDRDPEVVPGRMRACESACGSGTQVCVQGRWSDCTAPVDCSCEPDEERDEPCGRCGTAVRKCDAQGAWGEAGDCEGEGGECVPGAMAREPCGNCGARSRSCGRDCEWEEWGGCDGEHGCAPGDVETETCGGCGSRSRSCDDRCEWEAWETCELDGECSPGDTEECGNCGTRVCSDDCAWGSCAGEGTCEPDDMCCPGSGDDRCSACAGNARRDCRDDCTWSGCISTGEQC